MNRIIAALLAGLLFALGNVSPAPAAEVAQAAPSVADRATHQVGHITCENYGACIVTFYDGYVMARRYNGTIWVRLTYVPFAYNAHVSNLQCPHHDESCIIGYSYTARAWYGRHVGLPDQYRLTMIDGQ